MTLEKYRQKRDFSKTPEPRGAMARTASRLSYFIQKHHARNLHYDFRLELDGTLKSWAVPKGPSLDPADKRLAVHVEDHPLSYGTFEGDIPPHQYGAGSVLVWDKGVWIPEGDPHEGLRKGRLKFQLKGEKLKGGWALVRMGPPGAEKENWLLIKERDSQAQTGDDARITELQPDSVMDGAGKQSARTKRPAASGKQAAVPDPPAAPVRVKPVELDGAVKAPMPEMIKPQLATLADKAPSGDDWLSEIKFDGYRTLCKIDHKNVKLFTRSGNDWTGKWKAIAEAASRLPAKQAWLDGEVVAIADDGSISFQRLQNMVREGAPGRLAYYVFDLVYLNGADLHRAPLIERKQLLKALLAKVDANGPILFSDHVQGHAPDAFAHACTHELEGIITKRADAAYQETRSRSWLKVKCHQRQEFVVGGYTDPAGSREKFGALLLGVHEDGQLHYAGRVGTGFGDATLAALAKEFPKLAAKTSPFVDPPSGRDGVGVHWLKPKMVAEIRFAQWTDSGVIRHASFIGLRDDKPARDIRHEKPVPVANAAAHASDSTRTTVAGITLSHPSKILFPDVGVTKLQLAQYYEEMASWILPHLARRPLTIVRCPHGGGQQCFFQKHATEATAPEIARVDVPSGAGTATYMMANSLPALISLVQMGVLELHTWGASAPRLGQPDRMIFDLDPAPDLPWIQVVEAAQLVRGLLDEIGLTSFVKTTGGKGLHVVVPLKAEKPWDEVKGLSRAIAEHLAATLPERFTAKMTKTKRVGKIFIDYLRNAAEATAIAAYSTRTRPGAPVSVPIAWDELTDDLRSDSYTVLNLRERIKQMKEDPWKQYFSLDQRITKKMMRTFDLA